MSRLQLALRVADIDAAVEFYAAIFGAQPHKRREGYANFALVDPPLKLVLFEREGVGAAEIDHMGIEVDSTDDVAAAVAAYEAAGLSPEVRTKELCCHAVQDKLLLDGADGHEWEVYTVVDDLLRDGEQAAMPPRHRTHE